MDSGVVGAGLGTESSNASKRKCQSGFINREYNKVSLRFIQDWTNSHVKAIFVSWNIWEMRWLSRWQIVSGHKTTRCNVKSLNDAVTSFDWTSPLLASFLCCLHPRSLKVYSHQANAGGSAKKSKEKRSKNIRQIPKKISLSCSPSPGMNTTLNDGTILCGGEPTRCVVSCKTRDGKAGWPWPSLWPWPKHVLGGSIRSAWHFINKLHLFQT